MMLIASPLAMPSTTLYGKKRKNRQEYEDLPPSKRSDLTSKSLYSKSQFATALRSSRGKEMILSNGDHVSKVPSESRRQASLNAKIALRLHYNESGSAQKKPSNKQENGGVYRDQYANGNQYNSNPIKQISPLDTNSPLPGNTLTRISPLESEESDSILLSERRENKPNNGLVSRPVKKPALMLTDYKKEKTNPDKSVSNLSEFENGGYVRRLASLNASACVSAMMEPEKKVRAHKNVSNNDLKHYPVRSGSESSDGSFTSPTISILKEEGISKGEILNSPAKSCSSSSLASSPGIGFSKEIFDDSEPQVYTLLALASIAASCQSEDIQYNTLGLLYNGDTIHPNARLFYASDVDLSLPRRIIPTIVPSQVRSVNMVTDRAYAENVSRKRKAAKANNGWMSLGSAIKTISYDEGSNAIVRRYYAGIRRNSSKETIFVRDCVLIRSGGSPREEKPFVAKIASIWQEQPGQLMMTVFWYYRPDEVESITEYRKDELLASQHHDDNSVACIEEKCYVLGMSEYCRYLAHIQCKKNRCTSRSRRIVPVAKSTKMHHFIPSNSKGKQSKSGTPPPSLLTPVSESGLAKVEPELVYLCHRGYNHCTGKLVSKSVYK